MGSVVAERSIAPRRYTGVTTDEVRSDVLQAMNTRRSFLTLLGTIPFATGALSSLTSASGSQQPEPLAGDKLDEALEMLAPYAPSFRGGLSNHGPMTAEALISLGRDDAVMGWVENYRRRLVQTPPGTDPIDPAKWEEALGVKARGTDWEEHFARELAEASWAEVVGKWVPRLAPGIAAAGLHGVIRVGHAVCSLAVKETAPRLDELARALGYWATEYLELPGEYSGKGKLAPSLALAKVEKLPDEARKSRGLITTELGDLAGYAPFVDTIDLVDPAKGAPTFMSDLAATFAGVFVYTRSNSFEFLHGVTGAAAISELLPYVAPAARPAVQAYTWQATAGLYARYAQPGLTADLKSEPKVLTGDQLATFAQDSGDAHTIKLVAACLRESRRSDDPRFLAAATVRVL